MNITLEQYNLVVNGLRTQLELHRALTEEKIERIKTQQELLNLHKQDIDKLDSVNARITETNISLVEKLNSLGKFLLEHPNIYKKAKKKGLLNFE